MQADIKVYQLKHIAWSVPLHFHGRSASQGQAVGAARLPPPPPLVQRPKLTGVFLLNLFLQQVLYMYMYRLNCVSVETYPQLLLPPDVLMCCLYFSAATETPAPPPQATGLLFSHLDPVWWCMLMITGQMVRKKMKIMTKCWKWNGEVMGKTWRQ